MKESSGIIGENNFLFYNKKRLFINSRVGCLARCNYCYLDRIGIPRGKIAKQIQPADIIRVIGKNLKTIWKPDDTLASFGCYSDPWDAYSKHHTKKIMTFLNQNKYRVTLSTKQAVNSIDLEEIYSLDKSYLYFLISIPVANEISVMEKGTSSLRQRIESIKVLHENGFNVAIYIKPFLGDTTLKSLPEIVKILQCISLPVILGKLFVSSPGTKGNKAVVSNSYILVESETREYFNVKNILQQYTTVYENSFQIFGD
ncbi:MAG: radical SAM protein [Candidatus Electrothrix sp. Rat3]|nr:radical SAM protein [Candidatus Electrothrix rattekaaiensis]